MLTPSILDRLNGAIIEYQRSNRDRPIGELLEPNTLTVSSDIKAALAECAKQSQSQDLASRASVIPGGQPTIYDLDIIVDETKTDYLSVSHRP